MARSGVGRLPSVVVVALVAFAAVLAVAVAHAPSGTGGASANGRIVFQRVDPELRKVRLYTVRPNGTDLRALTRPGRNEDIDSQPDWSPDGTKILFRRFTNPGRRTERTDLYVIDRNGRGLRNLTPGCVQPCLGSEEGEWSPDGRQIAFVRAIGPIPEDGPPPIVGLFLMNADGSNVRQITQLTPNSGTEDHNPSWSPDGRQIVFMRVRQGGRPPDTSAIYVVDSDGANLRLIRRMPPHRPGA